jgi:hypothetical protein
MNVIKQKSWQKMMTYLGPMEKYFEKGNFSYA